MRYSKGNIPPIPSVAPSMLFPHKKALLHGEELVLTPFSRTYPRSAYSKNFIAIYLAAIP